MLQAIAEQALTLLRARGFEQAQVSASTRALEELNITHNQPSLLRSTRTQQLSLLGLLDGRRASTALSGFGAEALQHAVKDLYAQALAAPRDDANAVSCGQRASIVQGPQAAEAGQLTGAVAQLLRFRAQHTPRMMLEEGAAAHRLVQGHTLTSGGTELRHALGCYALSVVGTAREGQRCSSFNYSGGDCHALDGPAAPGLFGIDDMLRDTEQQIDTQASAGQFVGEVVLAPLAVADVLAWLQAQLSDTQLIAGSSLYQDQVGQAIASPLLTLRSRFDAPGVVAFSEDAFVAPALTLLQQGVLQSLTPSLYGSRKTGHPHVPVASAGWEIDAGNTPRAELLAAVPRGALVGRLSMGMPAPNGDFSGVIKNSFLLDNGARGAALSEVMVSGNMAQLLRDVRAVSQERIDFGGLRLPWLRIGNLRFS